MALGFGFNKAKVLASAEKFVQQGKLPNAIVEYEKIAKEDPKDLTVLNTIGDLYARLNQNEHAAMYFRKVGDQYAHNGFTVKAIAIYKKLSKLSPNNNEIITKLAELYTQQGLYNDARVQYMHIAEGYLRSGDHTQAARIMQRILELDPENTTTQARLAELYVKLGKREDARNIYYTAAESLYARGQFDSASEALKKVITLDPTNSAALMLRGMIAADSGDHLNAAHYLDQVPDLDSKPEGLRALLRAATQSGDAERAEKAASKLLVLHKDSSGITGLADWFVSSHRVSDAVRLLEHNADRLFGGSPKAAQDIVRPLLERVKDNPEALTSLNRLMGGTAEAAPSAEVLEMQANAFAKKGQYSDARDLYKKLSEIEPEAGRGFCFAHPESGRGRTSFHGGRAG
jgi:tetratricopeptide (TPR) repeat protein